MARSDERIDLGFWFSGFLQGAAALSPSQRERLFRSCARGCLAHGVMAAYGELFERVGGDMDRFFSALGELDGMGARIVEPGRAWELSYERCSCPLHAEGYVDSPALCQCGRQSVFLVMHELWYGERFDVVQRGSVLAGDPACVLSITRL